jgi:hypothetical protein
MNQVTTKTSGDGLATLVPALGESFAHTCTTRVLLFWRNRLRHAHLYKSPRLPQVSLSHSLSPSLTRATTRLLLFWRNRLRHAHLYKSPRLPQVSLSLSLTCTTRMLLFWRNRLRHAHLYKSPRLPLVGALPHANLHLTATSQRRERGPGGLTCGYLVDSGRGCMVYAGDGAV